MDRFNPEQTKLIAAFQAASIWTENLYGGKLPIRDSLRTLYEEGANLLQHNPTLSARSLLDGILVNELFVINAWNHNRLSGFAVPEPGTDWLDKAKLEEQARRSAEQLGFNPVDLNIEPFYFKNLEEDLWDEELNFPLRHFAVLWKLDFTRPGPLVKGEPEPPQDLLIPVDPDFDFQNPVQNLKSIKNVPFEAALPIIPQQDDQPHSALQQPVDGYPMAPAASSPNFGPDMNGFIPKNRPPAQVAGIGPLIPPPRRPAQYARHYRKVGAGGPPINLEFPNGELTACEILAFFPEWLQSIDVVQRFCFNGGSQGIFARIMKAMRRQFGGDHSATLNNALLKKAKKTVTAVHQAQNPGMTWDQAINNMRTWKITEAKASRPHNWDEDNLDVSHFRVPRITHPSQDFKSRWKNAPVSAVPFKSLAENMLAWPAGLDALNLTRCIDYHLHNPNEEWLFPTDFQRLINHIGGPVQKTPGHTDGAAFARWATGSALMFVLVRDLRQDQAAIDGKPLTKPLPALDDLTHIDGGRQRRGRRPAAQHQGPPVRLPDEPAATQTYQQPTAFHILGAVAQTQAWGNYGAQRQQLPRGAKRGRDDGDAQGQNKKQCVGYGVQQTQSAHPAPRQLWPSLEAYQAPKLRSRVGYSYYKDSDEQEYQQSNAQYSQAHGQLYQKQQPDGLNIDPFLLQAQAQQPTEHANAVSTSATPAFFVDTTEAAQTLGKETDDMEVGTDSKDLSYEPGLFGSDEEHEML